MVNYCDLTVITGKLFCNNFTNTRKYSMLSYYPEHTFLSGQPSFGRLCSELARLIGSQLTGRLRSTFWFPSFTHFMPFTSPSTFALWDKFQKTTIEFQKITNKFQKLNFGNFGNFFRSFGPEGRVDFSKSKCYRS